jgi:prophage regulatory protein
MSPHETERATTHRDFRPEASLRIVRERECREMTGLSRPQRWRLERVGKFPKRLSLSEKSIGWLEHEIQSWIRARLAERDTHRLVA